MERRDPGRGGARPPAEDPKATIKGALIIAAAILLGFVLLTSGFNSEGESASLEVTTTLGPGTTIDRDAPPPTTSPSQSTTITAPPTTRAPSELTLIVSNGSGKSGVAGTFATQLRAKGYTVKDTANAAITATSNVFYVEAEGAQADAAALAEALGWPATSVAPMPSTPPVGGKSMDGVDLVVVVGSDQG
jgi:hypothetical protein